MGPPPRLWLYTEQASRIRFDEAKSLQAGRKVLLGITRGRPADDAKQPLTLRLKPSLWV
jgi:hypothetical protein